MKDSWEVKKLGDLVKTIKAGGTPSSTNADYYNGEIPFVSIEDITDSHKVLNKTKKFLSRKGIDASAAWLVPRGYLIYSMYASVGKVRHLDIDAATSQAIIAFNNDSSIIEKDYLYYFLLKLESEIYKYTSQTTQANLNAEKVKNFKIQFPPLPQQRKIAQILSTVDAVLEKTEAAIAKYQQLKQGLMHDLFTRGIDVHTGQLRPKPTQAPERYKQSPLGWIPKEWEIGQFIDFADERVNHSFTGGPFGSDLQTKHYTKEGVRIIQLQNIGDGFFNNKYKIFTSEERANYLKACNIYPGEIILSKMAEPIARACIIPNFHDRYLMASDGIRLSIDKKKFNTRFVLETINQRRFRSIAELRATGTTRSRIGLNELKEIPVAYPDIKEQNLIGEKLDTIESKIHTEQQALAKYQQLKAGLLQDLLTGRVEVEVI